MTQPTFVPHQPTTTGTAAYRLAVPEAWSADRPAELVPAAKIDVASNGKPGPNQGYALTLAHRLHDRLVLTSGEHGHDVEVGAALIACRRASMFGRAPSIYDVTMALELFGFLDEAPAELVAHRKPLFSSLGHSYVAQRQLVDSIPEATLRGTPAAARDLDWREALGIS